MPSISIKKLTSALTEEQAKRILEEISKERKKESNNYTNYRNKKFNH